MKHWATRFFVAGYEDSIGSNYEWLMIVRWYRKRMNANFKISNWQSRFRSNEININIIHKSIKLIQICARAIYAKIPKINLFVFQWPSSRVDSFFIISFFPYLFFFFSFLFLFIFILDIPTSKRFHTLEFILSLMYRYSPSSSQRLLLNLFLSIISFIQLKTTGFPLVSTILKLTIRSRDQWHGVARFVRPFYFDLSSCRFITTSVSMH